ncbi:MAG: glycoprotease [Allisonella histaminiformans]|uniref:glycoprotease n=1 Tax=Allisonella histaminiformans TaxID=209880 RepID=UPI002A813A7D|nr:glycoprotease [Allisonella histaminiformans]MDY3957111.1 glycoprotease [Allisonella histaminiformans]
MARFIGIDTSCYTTSVAVYDSQQGLVAEERTVLKVKQGHRGLSQSEMVYQHVRNLPELFHKIGNEIHSISGIGVSAFPRRRADSYMPAFLVGKGAGEMLSQTLHVPLYLFSHQENHAMAAMRNRPEIWNIPFYMMHLSGGTQDVLSVTWEAENMHFKNVMTSMDITAGQLIDRVGVALGLPFPAGKHVEALAKGADNPCQFPVARVKNAFSFSGVETTVQKCIREGNQSSENVAAGVLQAIGRALKKELLSYPFESGRTMIAVGGVMSNTYLRHIVMEIGKKKGLTVLFADPVYSSDNASGNAFGAFMRYSHEKGNSQ